MSNGSTQSHSFFLSLQALVELLARRFPSLQILLLTFAFDLWRPHFRIPLTFRGISEMIGTLPECLRCLGFHPSSGPFHTWFPLCRCESQRFFDGGKTHPWAVPGHPRSTSHLWSPRCITLFEGLQIGSSLILLSKRYSWDMRQQS